VCPGALPLHHHHVPSSTRHPPGAVLHRGSARGHQRFLPLRINPVIGIDDPVELGGGGCQRDSACEIRSPVLWQGVHLHTRIPCWNPRLLPITHHQNT